MPEVIETSNTILVVDDQEMIRDYISLLLTGRDTALIANGGADALRQSREHKGNIDLLLSNIQMPGMTGIELSTTLTHERPEMRVLLMSGFTSGVFVLGEGWQFVPKPFLPSQLYNLISGVLAIPNPADTLHLDEH